MTRDIFVAPCSWWDWAPWHDQDNPAPWTPPQHKVITITDFIAASTLGAYHGHVIAARAQLDKAWAIQKQLETCFPWDEAELIAARNRCIDAYKWAKAAAPCAVLQGVNPNHNNTDFESEGGVMCLDFDSPKPGEPDNGNGHVTDWEEVKSIMAQLPCVAYCGLSIGGRGLFVLIPIARPGADVYLDYYTAAAEMFKTHLGLVVDEKCKNLGRMRFMSCDPQPYYNRAALVWDKVLTTPRDWREAPRLEQPCSLNDEQKQAVRVAVKYCTDNGVNVADDYETWLRLGAFFAHCWDDAEGENLFHSLAALSHKYKARENDYKLRNLRREHPNPVKFGSFVKIMRDHGAPMPGRRAHAFKPWATSTPAQAIAPNTGFIDAASNKERTKSNSTGEKCEKRPATATKPAAPAVAPPQEQTAPQPPQMSASEARELEAKRPLIDEGFKNWQSMVAHNAALIPFVADFGLDYCGPMDEGCTFTMTRAQTAAYRAG